MKIAVLIPIYNPDEEFIELLNMLRRQKGVRFKLIILETVAGDKRFPESELKGFNYKIISVDPKDFNHGLTRQRGIDEAGDIDVAIFMTQDAIPADEFTISNMVSVFTDPKVGCGYGRQLPKADATPFAAHARLFNYPDKSYVRFFEDRKKYGIKTAFSSDSFAAYRISALRKIGGFPKLNFSEDMYVTAKMLMSGYGVAYQSNAKVYHSHNYSIMEEFKRYREIGAFHAQQPWIRDTFGQAEGEGVKFVKSEIAYLMKHNPLLLLIMVLRNGAKFLAYKL